MGPWAIPHSRPGQQQAALHQRQRREQVLCAPETGTGNQGKEPNQLLAKGWDWQFLHQEEEGKYTQGCLLN